MKLSQFLPVVSAGIAGMFLGTRITEKVLDEELAAQAADYIGLLERFQHRVFSHTR